MSKFGSKQLIPLATAAVACTFLFIGLTQFGFWNSGKGPTAGFVPIIISVLMLAVSILAFVQSFKEAKPEYKKDNLLVIAGGVGIFAATFLIGLIPSVAVYVIVWLKGLEKCTWKQTMQVWAVIMAIVVGVFVLWLKVPFPQGIIIDTLLS